jgi:hypothetical protein
MLPICYVRLELENALQPANARLLGLVLTQGARIPQATFRNIAFIAMVLDCVIAVRFGPPHFLATMQMGFD